MGALKYCVNCGLYKFEKCFEVCPCGVEYCSACLYNSIIHLKHMIDAAKDEIRKLEEEK